MKQYCRYCAFCINGDGYYCTDRERPLNRVDTVTTCESFAPSRMGDVDTGRQYRPRKKKICRKSNEMQINFYEWSENNEQRGK